MKFIVVMLFNANNGTTQNQQVITQGIWDAIDAELHHLLTKYVLVTKIKNNW